MQYVIPAFLALIVGLILWLIKKDRTGMDYEVIASQVYPHESGKGKYFVINIRNTGNQPIKNSTIQIIFNSGSIEFVNFSDENLVSNPKQEVGSFSYQVPLLNPQEVLSMTITTKDVDEDTSPRITARAEGVTAQVKKQVERYVEYFQISLLTITLGIAATAVLLTWTSFKQTEVKKSIENIESIGDLRDEMKETKETIVKTTDKLEIKLKELSNYKLEREQGKPAVEQYIFAILNTSDLGHLMPDLISMGAQIEYWKTGAFLLHNFLVDLDNSSKYIKAMEQLIAIEEMAPSSKGYNLYLLGKMTGFIGDKEKNLEYFARCKEETPLMYEHLMSQDPAFDMVSLQKSLKEKRGKAK